MYRILRPFAPDLWIAEGPVLNFSAGFAYPQTSFCAREFQLLGGSAYRANTKRPASQNFTILRFWRTLGASETEQNSASDR